MRIYVASSWRNHRQPSIVAALKGEGHEVYDFRHPTEDNNGFDWADIDKNWKQWTPEQFRAALQHDIAIEGLAHDQAALENAEATVLVMPCGRSAHLELGVAIGLAQATSILLTDGEPELMYGLVDLITPDLSEIVTWLKLGCPE